MDTPGDDASERMVDTPGDYAGEYIIDTLDDYVYEALEKPDETIRLLEILSIAPHICCKLIVVPLNHLPNFTALSYVWGNSNARESVEVEGKRLKTSSSLASALRDIYGQFERHPVGNGTAQWLWADGMCINQADNHEKNDQVPLMRDIYSKCTRMFSWLGGEKDRVTAKHDISNGGVVDAIKFVSTGIATSPGYNLFMSGFDHNTYLSDDALMEYNNGLKYQTGHEFANLAWLQVYYNNIPDSNLYHGTLFKKIFRLIEMPYWKRLWILQEFVLAQDKNLLCGSKTVSWTTICRVFTWIRLIKIHYGPSNRPDYIPEHVWGPLIGCGCVPHPFQLIALGTSLQSTNVIGAQIEKHQQHWVKLHFHGHAALYRATDPKDYIYGMTGVTGYQVKPDYSRKTTVAEVYQRFTEACIITTRKARDKGSLTAGSDFLWFFGLAGMGFEWRNTPDLPTWVPDFAGASEGFSRHPNEPMTYFDQTVGQSDKNLGIQDIPHIEGSCLCCMTIFVDKVCSVGPLLLTCTPSGQFRDVLSRLFDCVLESRANNRSPAGYGLFRAICRLLSDQYKPSQEQFDRFLEMVLADLEYLCDVRRDLSRSEFFAQLCKELSRSQTDDALRRSDWSSIRPRHEPKVWQDRIVDSVFYQSVMIKVHKLCIAFTTSGHIGLLPTLAQVGDLVGVINGFALPLILRKSGEGYALVGPCHMPGFMEGEAAEMLQDGRAKMEEIRIY